MMSATQGRQRLAGLAEGTTPVVTALSDSSENDASGFNNFRQTWDQCARLELDCS